MARESEISDCHQVSPQVSPQASSQASRQNKAGARGVSRSVAGDSMGPRIVGPDEWCRSARCLPSKMGPAHKEKCARCTACKGVVRLHAQRSGVVL